MPRSRLLKPALVSVALGAALLSPVPMTQADPVARAASAATTRTLYAGDALVAGSKRSKLVNGWYSLEAEPGTVTLYEFIPVPGSEFVDSAGTGTWFRQDPTGNDVPNDRTRLRLTRQGDLVLVTAAGRRLWHSGTKGSGAVRLTLHRGGNLALHTKSGKIVWTSRSGQVQMSGGMVLKPGEQLRDAWETAFGGDPITLTMQRDGNLVHRCGSRIDWQTRTSVPGSTLRMHRGGVLRVVTPKGRTVWSSRSGGYDYAHFNSRHMTIEVNGIDMVWYARLNYEAC